MTEIQRTEIEDVENNNEDEAVDSGDKNLCIYVIGSDICESIRFGNVENENKIRNFFAD